jgi:lysine 6-dehydrogenase
MRVLVMGGGAQGSAAAFDLVRHPDVEHVVVADRAVDRPAPFLEPFLRGSGRAGPRLELRALDASDQRAVAQAMAGVDGVLCALPYFFNYDMAALAVAARAHYCDLGGNTEIVERQRGLDAEARRHGLSVIPDCGLAPGMVNILAQAGIDALERVDSVRLFVGGLPQYPRPPLNYQIVYSLQGVLDYYTTPSVVLEGGQMVVKRALSELEDVTFPAPVGTLEAFHTAGGASTMPKRYLGKIPEMVYKTLRYPGHARIMESIRELGLFGTEPIRVDGHDVVPRDLFIEVATPYLTGEDPRDLVALRVLVKGARGGAPRTIRYDVLDRYDEEHGITAMMRTTGYSLSVTTLMQVDGRVRELGVHTPDETIPADEYIRELAGRGIEIVKTEI